MDAYINQVKQSNMDWDYISGYTISSIRDEGLS